MRNKPSPKTIGLFVLGGIVLFFAGIITFSSAEFFSRRLEYVMYFDGTLKGLNVGSPVSFRGVQVGQVTNIVMEINRDRKSISTPVFVEIDPSRFKVEGGISLLAEPPIKRMVEAGLRAQLQNQSLITGQMYIELGYHPRSVPEFKAGEGSSVDEIPTVPSPLDQVQDTLKVVLDKVRTLELDKLVGMASDTLKVTHATLNELLTLTQKVNARIDPILTNIDNTTGEGQVTLQELQATLKELNKAIGQANQVFRNVDKEVATLSPTVAKGADNARTAFDEISAAMRAMRELAEYLERNPDALLTGKQNTNRR